MALSSYGAASEIHYDGKEWVPDSGDQLVYNPTTTPYSSEYWIQQSDAVDYTITTTSSPFPAMSLDDDSVIQFSGGFQITGKEFRTYMKVLQKIVEQDFPEELF